MLRVGRRIKIDSHLFIVANSGLDFARLGISVAKKNIKSAPNRNYCKRVHRELFRGIVSRINGFDIIVMPMVVVDYASAKHSWERLWQLLQNL